MCQAHASHLSHPLIGDIYIRMDTSYQVHLYYLLHLYGAFYTSCHTEAGYRLLNHFNDGFNHAEDIQNTVVPCGFITLVYYLLLTQSMYTKTRTGACTPLPLYQIS